MNVQNIVTNSIILYNVENLELFVIIYKKFWIRGICNENPSAERSWIKLNENF